MLFKLLFFLKKKRNWNNFDFLKTKDWNNFELILGDHRPPHYLSKTMIQSLNSNWVVLITIIVRDSVSLTLIWNWHENLSYDNAKCIFFDTLFDTNNGFSFSSYTTTTTTATVSSSAQKKWALFTEHTVSWSKFSNPSRSTRQGSSPLIWFNKRTLQFRCPSFELTEKTHRTGCFVDFSLV